MATIRTILLLGALMVGHGAAFATDRSEHGVYYNELKALKEREEARIIFDKEADGHLRAIQSDIQIFKELSLFQRLVRVPFWMFDITMVTPDSMPQLHAYITGICQRGNISVPTIFITRAKWLFNAAAAKLLKSTGGIIIGQKLMAEVTDQELEAVIAHELGHIKHNHSNKQLVLGLAITLPVYVVLCKCFDKWFSKINVDFSQFNIDFGYFGKFDCKGTVEKIQVKLALFFASSIPLLIINKRFEKEADQFAFECGKAEGAASFFERMIEKDQKVDEDFVITKNTLQQSKSQLSGFDYRMLQLRYIFAQCNHAIHKLYKYVYGNTFLGAHPSHEDRIAAAKKYLAEQQQAHA